MDENRTGRGPSDSRSGQGPKQGNQTQLRLRISHLLLCLASTAVLLTFWKNIAADFTPPPGFEFLSYATQLAHGIVYATVLSAAAIQLLERSQNGLALARQPGHWLTLIQAATILGELVAASTILENASSFRFYWIIFCLTYFLGVVGFVLAYWRTQVLRWKYLFGLLCLISLLGFFSSLSVNVLLNRSSFGSLFTAMRFLASVGRIVSYFWMIFAIAKDRRERIQHDWLHWIGVTCFLLIPLFSFLLWLAFSPN